MSRGWPRGPLTDGAKVRVRHGEAIRTQYEILAPIVDNSSCQLSGRGFSVLLGCPRFQCEKMSRAEQFLRDRGLILRHAAERRPGRYVDARCLAMTPSWPWATAAAYNAVPAPTTPIENCRSAASSR